MSHVNNDAQMPWGADAKAPYKNLEGSALLDHLNVLFWQRRDITELLPYLLSRDVAKILALLVTTMHLSLGKTLLLVSSRERERGAGMEALTVLIRTVHERGESSRDPFHAVGLSC